MYIYIHRHIFTHTHTYTHTQVILFSHEKEGNFTICYNMMDLEGIMLIEISQTEKDKYCMVSLICEI